MSCYLSIIGQNFDVNNFIEISKLVPESKWFHEKQKKSKIAYSGMSLLTSSANFKDFKLQIEETTVFLKKHKRKLAYIKKSKDIEFATLTFGVDSKGIRNNGVQSHFFPKQFLQLTSELSLDIELTIYSIEESSKN